MNEWKFSVVDDTINIEVFSCGVGLCERAACDSTIQLPPPTPGDGSRYGVSIGNYIFDNNLPYAYKEF